MRSGMGQKRQFRDVRGQSAALPPIFTVTADITNRQFIRPIFRLLLQRRHSACVL
jgi:hypothetical protein